MQGQLCVGCGASSFESNASYCWSCGALSNVTEELGDWCQMKDEIKVPPELVDSWQLCKEFWEFFVQTLKTDHVVPSNITDLIIDCGFDDMPTETRIHLVEALKTNVVDRWFRAYVDGMKDKPELPTPDPFVPDFGIVDVEKAKYEATQEYPCYGGCGRVTYNQGSICPICVGDVS